MAKGVGIAVAAVVAAAAVALVAADGDADNCRALGFAPTLACHTCAALREQLPGDALVGECEACCHGADTGKGAEQYPKAQLYRCETMLATGKIPHVAGFIKEHLADFPAISLKPGDGVPPVVKLLDAKSKTRRTVAIDGWTTEEIREFFEVHLVSA